MYPSPSSTAAGLTMERYLVSHIKVDQNKFRCVGTDSSHAGQGMEIG